MNTRVIVTAAFVVALLLLAPNRSYAQSPPPPGPGSGPPPGMGPSMPPPGPGFVPPFEIMRNLRAAGFDPLAPPLREGTTYVVRATDFRGILMRVVVDARTGAIRDANRIVPGPGRYGQVGMMPPYGPADEGPAGYGPPPGFDPRNPPGMMEPDGLPSALAPGQTRAAARANSPPLPRPRPAELAARKSIDNAKSDNAKSDNAKPDNAKPASVAADPKPEGGSGAKAGAQAGALAGTGAPAEAIGSPQSPTPGKTRKVLPPSTIND